MATTTFMKGTVRVEIPAGAVARFGGSEGTYNIFVGADGRPIEAWEGGGSWRGWYPRPAAGREALAKIAEIASEGKADPPPPYNSAEGVGGNNPYMAWYSREEGRRDRVHAVRCAGRGVAERLYDLLRGPASPLGASMADRLFGTG